MRGALWRASLPCSKKTQRRIRRAQPFFSHAAEMVMTDLFGRIGGWLYQQPYLLLSVTFLTWAINIVVGRYIAGHVPQMALSFYRWGFAFLILLPFAWHHLRRDWPAIRRNLPLMTVFAVTGTTGYTVPAYWGLQYTEAINALLIQTTAPLVVALMAFLLFGDRLTPRQMLGIFISFIGVVVILCRGDVSLLRNISFNRGDIWFFGSLVVIAFYSALLKKRPAMHPLSFLVFTLGWGTLFVIPLYLWEMSGGEQVTLDAKTLLTLIYVAIFPSIVAYICYNRGVQLIGPNRAAAFYPSIVAFGALFAIGFLGERPQIFHGVGCLMILCGVIVATRKPRAA